MKQWIRTLYIYVYSPKFKLKPHELFVDYISGDIYSKSPLNSDTPLQEWINKQ